MRSPTTLTLILACLVAACGGDGGGPVDSGLPADKTGAELTPDEAEQLCLATAENLSERYTADEAKAAACVFVGIMFTTTAKNTVEECELVAKMCRDAPPPEQGGEDPEASCMLPFQLDTCTASIEEIEACLTEQNDLVARGVREASCNDLGKTPEAPKSGPACTKAKASCPGIAP